MSTTVASIIKFKRGTEARWAEVNPILENGEPGYVYDKHKFKIGDGVTHWNDLPYMDGKTEVMNFTAVSSFPTLGDPNVIYKASSELSLYQFNPATNSYEKLSDGKTIDNIEHINGGNANG